jgi:hypothetical protein
MNGADSRYGLLAEFERAEQLLHATEQAVQAGYRRLDAYSPQPVEGLDEALRFRPRYLQWVIFLLGLGGGAGAYFMQYYACVVDYPLLVAGRPLHSWPAFIPITFELTILAAALTAAFGMLAANRLPMPYHPVFHVESFARASQDRFFLCIECSDPRFDAVGTRRFLESLAPLAVHEVAG